MITFNQACYCVRMEKSLLRKNFRYLWEFFFSVLFCFLLACVMFHSFFVSSLILINILLGRVCVCDMRVFDRSQCERYFVIAYLLAREAHFTQNCLSRLEQRLAINRNQSSFYICLIIRQFSVKFNAYTSRQLDGWKWSETRALSQVCIDINRSIEEIEAINRSHQHQPLTEVKEAIVVRNT